MREGSNAYAVDFVPARAVTITVKRNELMFKSIVVDFFPFCYCYCLCKVQLETATHMVFFFLFAICRMNHKALYEFHVHTQTPLPIYRFTQHSTQKWSALIPSIAHKIKSTNMLSMLFSTYSYSYSAGCKESTLFCLFIKIE